MVFLTQKSKIVDFLHSINNESHDICPKQGVIQDFCHKIQLLFETINRFCVLKPKFSKKQLNISNG